MKRAIERKTKVLYLAKVRATWEVNRLVLGSNSLKKNYIILVGVKLPTEDSLVDFTNYKE